MSWDPVTLPVNQYVNAKGPHREFSRFPAWPQRRVAVAIFSVAVELLTKLHIGTVLLNQKQFEQDSAVILTHSVEVCLS